MAKKFNIPKVEEMIEAGVHFGHPKRRWNPEMEKFIYSTEKNTSVIDLYQTADLLEKACVFLYNVAKNNGKIILVGTKRQASLMVKDYAQKAGVMFVNERWLGGTFTNFKSVQKSRDELKRLKEGCDKGKFNHYTKKERLLINRQIDKLELLVGGITGLSEIPQALVVIDVKREKTAVAEANQTNVPIVGLVDTNSDPRNIDYVVPGNDDAIKSIELFLKTVAEAIALGYKNHDPRATRKEKEPVKTTESVSKTAKVERKKVQEKKEKVKKEASISEVEEKKVEVKKKDLKKTEKKVATEKKRVSVEQKKVVAKKEEETAEKEKAEKNVASKKAVKRKSAKKKAEPKKKTAQKSTKKEIKKK